MSEQNSVPTTPNKRGRPPKKTVGESNNITQNVTNEFCALNSSQALSNYYFGFDIFDVYSPDQLAALVKDPITCNEILRKLSLTLYGTNGTYTNTVDYMTAMPTLDKVIVPHGKNNTKRTKNKNLMESVLHLIKDK